MAVYPLMTEELSPWSKQLFVVVGCGNVSAIAAVPELMGGPAHFHVLMTRKSINCVKKYQNLHTRNFYSVFSSHKANGHKRYVPGVPHKKLSMSLREK